jgi:hypothetical protein
MRTILAALATVVLVGPNQLRADDEAVEIVGKAVKAHGGEANLAKFGMCQIQSEGTVELVPDVPGSVAEFTFKSEYTAKPGKFKSFTKLSFSSSGTTVPVLSVKSVYNGEEGQVVIDGKSQLLNGEALKEFKAIAHEQQVGLLYPLLKDKSYELTVVSDNVKVSGKPAVAILVHRKGQKDIVLYFDKETNRLVKSKREFYHIGDKKTGEQMTFYKDYKNVGGAIVSHQQVTYHDGKQFAVSRTVGITLLKQAPDSWFEIDE